MTARRFEYAIVGDGAATATAAEAICLRGALLARRTPEERDEYRDRLLSVAVK